MGGNHLQTRPLIPRCGYMRHQREQSSKETFGFFCRNGFSSMTVKVAPRIACLLLSVGSMRFRW
jgi:hypothetical protein